MIKYSTGKKFIKRKLNSTQLSISSANRGMGFENDINISNQYYVEKELALVTKRPTPINVVSVDYSHGAKITNAFFEKQSTTDYNGVYQGHYLDFEAKSTKIKTSFPLNNVSSHQIAHLKSVINHGGFAFFLIEFSLLDEVYLVDALDVIKNYENGDRKSIPYDYIKENGIRVKKGYVPRLYWLEAFEEKYFKKPEIL